jgi:hypothetical protein
MTAQRLSHSRIRPRVMRSAENNFIVSPRVGSGMYNNNTMLANENPLECRFDGMGITAEPKMVKHRVHIKEIFCTSLQFCEETCKCKLAISRSLLDRQFVRSVGHKVDSSHSHSYKYRHSRGLVNLGPVRSLSPIKLKYYIAMVLFFSFFFA